MFSKGKADTLLLVRKLHKSLFVCFNDVTFVLSSFNLHTSKVWFYKFEYHMFITLK